MDSPILPRRVAPFCCVAPFCALLGFSVAASYGTTIAAPGSICLVLLCGRITRLVLGRGEGPQGQARVASVDSKSPRLDHGQGDITVGMISPTAGGGI
jgi:hypothetical protein